MITIHFIYVLIIAALLIVGVWAACGKDMVLGELADWAEILLPYALCKPLFLCPPCMSSIWGTTAWFYLGGGLFLWPVFILSLCGLLHIINIAILSKYD